MEWPPSVRDDGGGGAVAGCVVQAARIATVNAMAIQAGLRGRVEGALDIAPILSFIPIH